MKQDFIYSLLLALLVAYLLILATVHECKPIENMTDTTMVMGTRLDINDSSAYNLVLKDGNGSQYYMVAISQLQPEVIKQITKALQAGVNLDEKGIVNNLVQPDLKRLSILVELGLLYQPENDIILAVSETTLKKMTNARIITLNNQGNPIYTAASGNVRKPLSTLQVVGEHLSVSERSVGVPAVIGEKDISSSNVSLIPVNIDAASQLFIPVLTKGLSPFQFAKVPYAPVEPKQDVVESFETCLAPIDWQS